jgi:hypothetical protein
MTVERRLYSRLSIAVVGPISGYSLVAKSRVVAVSFVTGALRRKEL